MKVVMLMFDTLRRNKLPPYNSDAFPLPNFARLEQKTVRFDNFYVGSMPCMPARRDLHTGRLNFLHRSWGPLEPFDDSIFDIMKKMASILILLPTISITGKTAAQPTIIDTAAMSLFGGKREISGKRGLASLAQKRWTHGKTQSRCGAI